MKTFLSIFIFCVVLFLYLHIHQQLNISNDLEVYTIESPSKDKLEEICDLRQPIIFDFYNERIIDSCNLNNLNSSYGAFDVKLRDTSNKDDNGEIYLPFVLNEAKNVFENDTDKKIITENNEEFLTETGAIKNYRYNDGFLRPPLVSKCIYDFMSGSNGSTTPLRYDINFRNYYYVTEGEIDVKLIPPHSSKYLYSKKDYDNFEFRSPVDPWNVEEKYRADYDKIKSLDVNIKKGTILYIPPYWWYSIRYNNASVCTFKYRTFMNSLAIMPQSVLGLLQSQNIKRDVVNKLELKKEVQQEVKEEIEHKSNMVNNEDINEIQNSLQETVNEAFVG